jgi:hypothetical protein
MELYAFLWYNNNTKTMRIITFLIIFLCVPCFPQTFLAGELKGTYRKDNYIISGAIAVKAGDTLIFEGGSELRFQPMTGILVKGAFFANGTKENSILFTSLKSQTSLSNSTQDPASFYWSGLKVADSTAAVRLSYSMFCNAGVAIALESNTHEIIFDRVVFHKNEFLNLVRQSKPVGVKDDAEYIYEGTGKEMIAVLDQTERITTDDENAIGLNRRPAAMPWFIPVRVSLSCVALVGAGLWISGHYYAEKYDNEYHGQKNPQGAVNARQKRDGMALIQNIGMGLCGVGAGFFSVSFLF